ncbi:MAG: histidine--tRNA ligase [Candidatus Marinimicrobia bacterium]|nr:histidine--tRNA ligase [Candidatus Neomarinimicrobiota bacterium]
MNQIKSIKGTHDILPDNSIKWQYLEQIVHNVCKQFGYREIRTPIFEETKLFSRGVGKETDIVSKEMYSWKDRDGSSLTLRPELTAAVARSYIQHNLGVQSPAQKLYYIGPLFRRERPQKGRQRQFHQFGVETFGSLYPEQDAEIIALARQILSEFGLGNNNILHLNSIGSPDCRSAYKNALKDFIRPNLNKFSTLSQHRYETNTLRILDTKAENEKKILQDAPIISDYLTDEDKIHFDSVISFLNAMNIPFSFNPRLVRGLDYYSRTVFEFTSSSLGAQDALIGGGRYDGLVETLGGKATPAVGFAAGMERFFIALEHNRNTELDTFASPDIYFICINKNGLALALKLCKNLRKIGKNVVMDSLRRSIKAQLREANKSGAKYALILGDEEILSNTIIIKDLKKGEQSTVEQTSLLEKL